MADTISDSLNDLNLSENTNANDNQAILNDGEKVIESNTLAPISYSEKLSKSISKPEEKDNEIEQSSLEDNKLDKKYKFLVLDTNPLLRGENLSSYAERFVTIPDVISEIVSKQARDRLDFVKIALNLEIIEPDSVSINEVIKKSKETGDFNFLSITDIKVISLAYMLSKQHDGKYSGEKNTQSSTNPNISTPTTSIGSKIATSNSNSSLSKEEERKVEKRVDDYFLGTPEIISEQEIEEAGIETEELIDKHVENSENQPIQENIISSENSLASKEDVTDAGEKVQDEKLSREDSQSDVGDSDDGGEWNVVKKAVKKNKNKKKYKNVFGWGGEWITPENITHAKVLDASFTRDISSGLKMRTRGEDAQHAVVGSVTSDYAMQNVILGMGMCLVSLDGFVIKELKTWVMRCHSCFEITPKMDIQFCPSCGHPTLIRASVSSHKNNSGGKNNSSGKDGETIVKKVHLKKNFKYNLQGTKYSIPAPVGGKSGVDIITRADDKRYLDSMARRNLLVSKMERQQLKGDGGLWDVGYVPDMLIGSGSGSKARNGERFDARGMPIIGFGRKNPNRAKKTGNRKK
ncbi:20S-pre-rRNA D-site endonuclease nob1 [Smittium culicis]|uniref:20S-pre-rRNA D-site endonuclease NOB1 n=1 Tax=Smittium culicis TaxID=133412 RepID=A0A1R1Y7R3_9FUNG|nr:20S-pre-rRNA D-site endonuclease nob1 [Smittium culicis]